VPANSCPSTMSSLMNGNAPDLSRMSRYLVAAQPVQNRGGRTSVCRRTRLRMLPLGRPLHPPADFAQPADSRLAETQLVPVVPRKPLGRGGPLSRMTGIELPPRLREEAFVCVRASARATRVLSSRARELGSWPQTETLAVFCFHCRMSHCPVTPLSWARY
jgi:hypothetical protein